MPPEKPGARMYLTTERNPGLPPAPGWPEPHLLILTQTTAPARLAALQRRFLVFQFATAPVGGLDAIRAALLRSHEARVLRWQGPLLYDRDGMAPAETAALLRAPRADRWRIAHETAPDGTLTRLILGEGIVTHPLLPGFFANMQPAIPDSAVEASLAILKTHLVQAAR